MSHPRCPIARDGAQRNGARRNGGCGRRNPAEEIPIDRVKTHRAGIGHQPALNRNGDQIELRMYSHACGTKIRQDLKEPLRILDLWLRPRTEILPLDAHWWKFREDPYDFAWSLPLGIINGAYVLLAIAGGMRWREIRYVGLLAMFVVLRTVIINAITFPETRYVLECYPVIILLAAMGLSRRTWMESHPSKAS